MADALVESGVHLEMPSKLKMDVEFLEMEGQTLPVLGRLDMYNAGLLEPLGKALQAWPMYKKDYWVENKNHGHRAVAVENQELMGEAFPAKGKNDVHKVTIENDKDGMLKVILREFKDVFDGDLTKPSTLRPIKLKLKEGHKLPGKGALRRIPPAYHSEERKLREEMIREGIIRTHSGPVASPIHLAGKPGHSKEKPILRYCIDYKKVNAELQELNYPLPVIEDLLHRLEQCKYYCTIDLKSGFHQIKVHKDSQYLLAFVTPDGQYTFTRLPFGIKVAPSYFQSELDRIFEETGLRFCLVYIDDVIFGANSVEELANRLRQVLAAFRKHGITVKGAKTTVGRTKVRYLGHEISKGRIALDKERVKAIHDLKPPRNAKELSSFLGAVNFCRKFLRNYGEMARPLYALTRKNTEWIWGAQQQETFDNIKKALTSAPVLTTFKTGAYTVLRTDASIMGVGGVLLQGTNDEDLKPVAFVSKGFNPQQSRWSTFDQEAYAIVYATERLRHFLVGQRFTLDTDHRNLTYLRSSSTAKIERWYLKLADLDFEVRHIPGVLNVTADFLSRHLDPAFQSHKHVPTHHALAFAATTRGRKILLPRSLRKGRGNRDDSTSSDESDDERSAEALDGRGSSSSDMDDEPTTASEGSENGSDHMEDEEGSSTSEEADEFHGELHDFFADDGPPSVLQNFRPALPDHVCSMISHVHNSTAGHGSVKRALWLLRVNSMVWPTMEEDVRLYIASCPVCQLVTDKHGDSHPGDTSTRSQEVFEIVAVDTITKLEPDKYGNTVIFVFICTFTNFIELVPAKSKEAKHAATALLQVVGRYGTPRALRCDRGTEYINDTVQHLMALMDMNEDYRPPYTPQANGVVERANKEVLRHLKAIMVCKGMLKGHWSVALSFIQRVLNSTPTTATGGIAPMVMLYGDRVTPLRHLFKRHYSAVLKRDEDPVEWVKHAKKMHNRIVSL